MTPLPDAITLFEIAGVTEASTLRAELLRLAGGDVFQEEGRDRFWNAFDDFRTPSLLPRLIAIYVILRQRLLHRIERGELNSPSAESDLHLALFMLLGECGDRSSDFLTDIEALLLDGDGEMYFLASNILEGATGNPFVSIDAILATFSEHGLCEHPYRLGKAVVDACQYDRHLADKLIGALQTDENTDAAIMAIVAKLPVEQLVRHDAAVRIASCHGEHSEAVALQALGKIGLASEKAVSLMSNALVNKKWYVRAAAAEAVGRLRLNPDKFLPRLARMLQDVEGHDYTVRDCAVLGIGYYGKCAVKYTDALTSLRQQMLADGYDREDLEDIDQALSRIDT